MTTTDDYLVEPPPPLGPWAQHAACRGLDPELFFPERGGDTATPKAICATCPVTAECLAYALDNGIKFGIFGGASERDRRRMRRDARQAAGHAAKGPIPGTALRQIVHGTAAGYQAHWRRHEEPCRACREAHMAAQLERKPGAQCGTVAGYRRHAAKQETVCRDCHQAYAAWRRERRALQVVAVDLDELAAQAERYAEAGRGA